jgi:L-asparagine transporter-like permease
MGKIKERRKNIMKEKITKLIDVKSIATLTLLLTLEIITIMVFTKNDMDLIQLVFTLFSNIVTMVFTYFFTKKQKESE